MSNCGGLIRIPETSGTSRFPNTTALISISCTKSLHNLGQTTFIGGADGSIGVDKMCDTTSDSVSDEALADLTQKMDEQRLEIHQTLADDLGTDPAAYRHQDG